MTLTSPISPAAIEKYGENIRENPVGAGPYILKEWVKGDRIVMVRNENYYGKKPTVEKLTFKIIPEDATREAMLRSGQIDVCYKPLPSNVASLKADPTSQSKCHWTRGRFSWIELPERCDQEQTGAPGFQLCVDKKAICSKILFDTAVPMEVQYPDPFRLSQNGEPV